MERSSIINTVTLLFVVVTMIVLLKTNSVPKELLPSSDTYQKISLELPEIQKKPVAVLPGALKKTENVETPIVSETPTGSALTRKGIIQETNSSRAKNDIGILKENTQLDASAQVKAKDILARQYFAHTAPDGKTVSELVAGQNYTYLKIGENLALGNFADNPAVVTAWMNSPGHRANILDAQFTEIGVGVAYGTYQGHTVSVAVQHFGRPTSSCPTIDQNLKSRVTIAEKYLNELVVSLDAQKATIDKGSESGDVNTLIDTYNKAVNLYHKLFSEAEIIRTQYNAEVSAFNNCLKS